MSKYPTWDIEKYPFTCDYILQLLEADYEPSEVYWAVSRYFLLNNNTDRQSLANKIAVLKTCNVMAGMPIPTDSN